MNIPSEFVDRRGRLGDELKAAIVKSGKHARVNRRISLGLMLLALLCSVAAGVLGFFLDQSGKVVGGIAVLPP